MKLFEKIKNILLSPGYNQDWMDQHDREHKIGKYREEYSINCPYKMIHSITVIILGIISIPIISYWYIETKDIGGLMILVLLIFIIIDNLTILHLLKENKLKKEEVKRT